MTVSGASLVNSTCTIDTGNAASYVFAGNGAFITGANTVTGFDGISGDAEFVVFYNQDQNDDGSMDNSTCWGASVSCSTMVQPPLVFSSWKLSTTTEVPKAVTSTSKLLESQLVIPSPSI